MSGVNGDSFVSFLRAAASPRRSAAHAVGARRALPRRTRGARALNARQAAAARAAVSRLERTAGSLRFAPRPPRRAAPLR